MSDWRTKARSSNSTPVELNEELLHEKVVLYLTARNVYDDPIYCYIRLTLESLKQLKAAMDSGEDFMPANYGEILAAGKGSPTPEVKSEMAIKYDLVDIPKTNNNELGYNSTENIAAKVAKAAQEMENIPKAEIPAPPAKENDIIMEKPAMKKRIIPSFGGDDGGSLWD